MKTKKTGLRIYFIIIVMFTIITGVVLYVVQSETNDMVSELILSRAQTANHALAGSLQDLQDKALERAEIIAGSEFVVSDVKSHDRETLARTLTNLGEGIDSASICDSDGIVLAGTYNNSTGDDLSGNKTIRASLAEGVSSSTIEEMADGGLSVCASAAIYDQNDIIGVVNCYFDLTKNQYLDEFKTQNGCEATLFHGDKRINTTITSAYGSRNIGTKADDIVSETVITNKTEYIGRMAIFDKIYEGCYSPLIVEDQAIGMLFTGTEIDSTLERQRAMNYWIVLIAIIGAGAVVILIATLNRFTRIFTHTLQELSNKEASLNVLTNILGGMEALLYVSDLETDEIIFVNDKMKTSFGINDEVIGNTCWQVFRDADKRCAFCPKYKLFTNPGEPVIWDDHNTIKDRYYRHNDSIIDWPDGRRVHLSERYDITEKKQIEIEKMQALKKAEQASRAKSEFLSRISHEMRTPMNAIIGMTGIAKASGDLEKRDYCLDKIDNASKHLLSIIGDILDMSQIESGKFELAYEDFHFENMLTNTINIMNFSSDEKKQNLTLDLDKDVPSVIISDERRLGQVIANLLANAIKFTPEGGKITLRVRVTDKSDDCFTILTTVEDNGIGISKDSQSVLFKPFEQVDGGIARKFGGTGLGLAISKQIVEQMGGKIWVESEPGQGSKFSFTITVKEGPMPSTPASSPALSPVSSSAPSGSVEESAEIPAASGQRFTGKKTVLIAEDIEINRIIVQEMLSDTGLSIECAENGRQAFDMYQAAPDKYALILMDINMPEVDGHTATKLIRALDNPEAANIPIIAMTANVFQEDIEKCLAVGMNDHIGKPVDMAELIDKLGKYLDCV